MPTERAKRPAELEEANGAESRKAVLLESFLGMLSKRRLTAALQLNDARRAELAAGHETPGSRLDRQLAARAVRVVSDRAADILPRIKADEAKRELLCTPPARRK